ncbi:MAG: erythrose-4-phosphate dehydrogenase [Gammaproteobacteria bacterium AqS3]|nr:erythrose-4-phosphate dehydrogenase [Gammaproteobacteria bacterium AqS3]
MSLRLAINGYGRIGRCALRLLERAGAADAGAEVVLINDLGPREAIVHLTRYDSTHGRFEARIEDDAEGGGMRIDGRAVQIASQPLPGGNFWGDAGIDLVLECSGKFASREGGEMHLAAGAPRVLIGAPAGEDVDATIVWGINEHLLDAGARIVSAASCTTNCMAHLLVPLNGAVQIVSGAYTTVHAYTNDQRLIDSPHTDLRRARAAANAIVPTTTWADRALAWVVPELAGRLSGTSMRVPVLNVSCIELNLIGERTLPVGALNQLMRDYSEGSDGVLDWCDAPLVSVDFNGSPASGVFDATRTQVQGELMRVSAWYDNEWGYANRMLDIIRRWSRLLSGQGA